MTWHGDPLNERHVRVLRDRLTDDKARVLIFLGAGLSFGAARSRARFDEEHWYGKPVKEKNRNKPPTSQDALIYFAGDDDGQPLPSWPWLVSRMRMELFHRVSEDERRDSLAKFFRDEGPLDCAQLFRHTVGEANYREFLRDQFDVRHSAIQTTPSHHALVALDLPILFTTNYDELIEVAYAEAGAHIRVSADEQEFRARTAEHAAHHLVKLHGTIDRMDTVVLTREDYSRARVERRLMFDKLRTQMTDSSFLFIGFSLSDPNFNILRDDLRHAMGGDMPLSYTVQGRRDPIKQSYLESLDVNTIWLDSWNDLPSFLRLLSPVTIQSED